MSSRLGRPSRESSLPGFSQHNGVIESDNANYAGTRLARLTRDGNVERGDLVDGLETSRPYVDEGWHALLRE